MSVRTKLIALPAALALGVALPVGQSGTGSPSAVVFDRTSVRLNAPEPRTMLDTKAALESYALGDPLPSGWSVDEIIRDVSATLTGVALLPTGELQIVVTVKNEHADLSEARLYVDGALEVTATRANGGIVDRGGISLASLSTFFLPIAPLSLAVEWDDASGVTSREEVNY